MAAAASIVALLAALAPIAAPAGAAGAFTDDDGNVHEAAIERIAALGITKGCNPPANTRFCPDGLVTRGEMAAFLVRTFDLRETGASFTDTADSVFAADIDRLASAEITKGCNPPSNTRFCPSDLVTRGQMAAFLVRALGLSVPSTSSFTDTATSEFEADISRLAAAGITRGCDPPDNTRFCPNQPVRRDEMATFLSRTHDIATTGTTTSSAPRTSTSSSTPGTTATTSTPPSTLPPPPAGWANRAGLEDDLTDAAGASLDGRLYLAGGKRSATDRVRDFLVYDPVANDWDDLAPIPGTGREDVSLVAAGGSLYAFGGASSNPFIGNVSTAARFSPGSGSWSDGAIKNLDTGRSGMAAVVYGGNMWLIGGLAAAGDSLSLVDIYDIASNTYAPGPPLPSPRDHAGAAVIDGKLYVFGGRHRNGGVSEHTSVLRLDSPSDTSWSSSGMATMPRPRRSFVVGTGAGKIQLFGGESQGQDAIKEVDEFDPATGTWSTSLPDLPTARHGVAGATIGPSTFVVGGSLGSASVNLTDVNERFTR